MPFLSLKHNPIKKIIILLGVIGLLIAVPLTVFYNNEIGVRKSQDLATDGVNFEAPDFTGYYVNVNVSTFNPSALTTSLHYRMYPYVSGNYSETAAAFQVLTASRSFAFTKNDFSPMFDATYVMLTASGSKYPFDRYSTEFSATILTPDGNSTIRSAVGLAAVLDAWDVDIEISQQNNEAFVYMEFRRSGVTVFFALFVGLLMWLLSISALIIAISIWMRERKVEPPTIAVMAALLFALPAMRNSQPGIPGIGTSSDVASFFWAMALVSISLILLMANYIMMYKAEKPVAEKEKLIHDVETPPATETPRASTSQ